MKLDHAATLLDEQAICLDVLLEKYAKADEKTADDVRRRVAAGLAAAGGPGLGEHGGQRFSKRMVAGFIPAGGDNRAPGTAIPPRLLTGFAQRAGNQIG